MNDTILRGTPINLTLEELQAVLCQAESGLKFGGQTVAAELIGFTKGTIGDEPANLATFHATDEMLPPLVLLPVPEDSEEKKMLFFNKLAPRGLEIISYADVYVSGQEREIVTCRATASIPEPVSHDLLPLETEPTQPAQKPAAQAAPIFIPETEFPIPAPTFDPIPIPRPVPLIEPVPPPVPQVARPPGTPLTPPSAPTFTETTDENADEEISKKAVDLILEAEGLDQPRCWPGGASGITIGIGYDLGYTGRAEFFTDWEPHLDAPVLARLAHGLGVTGDRAHAMAPQFRDIVISKSSALKVFRLRTLPRYRSQALKAFPGMDRLPRDAQGALISLVFNRGTAMNGDRRREMLAIRNVILQHDPIREWPLIRDEIAHQLNEMQRLWRGQGLDGLLARRKAEASLVMTA